MEGLAARDAMAKARDLVARYAEAGFTKIHLDASMACADDRGLSEAEMAERAAQLCAVAEKTAGGAELLYVIGTEVPVPGGETETLDGLAVTKADAALRTYELHQAAFRKLGLNAALRARDRHCRSARRGFRQQSSFRFDKGKAASLAASIRQIPGAVFEAHSTDYQTAHDLHELVSANFAILKVGPELTAAYREAIVAMAGIEEWLPLPAEVRHHGGDRTRR